MKNVCDALSAPLPPPMLSVANVSMSFCRPTLRGAGRKCPNKCAWECRSYDQSKLQMTEEKTRGNEILCSGRVKIRS